MDGEESASTCVPKRFVQGLRAQKSSSKNYVGIMRFLLLSEVYKKKKKTIGVRRLYSQVMQ